jgi:hypothetical protein
VNIVWKVGDRVVRKDGPKNVGTVTSLMEHSVRVKFDDEPMSGHASRLGGVFFFNNMLVSEKESQKVRYNP